MKKLFFFLTCCLFTTVLFAQKGQEWVTQAPQDCFCCNDKIYNLPVKPTVSGPDYLSCDSSAVFTTMSCPGAQTQWTVSPAANMSGQNTATLTLSPVFTAASYTITVTIKCGNKTVSNQKVVKVKTITNCTPKFSIVLTELPNGNFRIDAIPQTTAGVWHYWGLVGNANGSTCTAVPLSTIQNNGTFGASVSPTGVFTHLGMGTGINPGSGNTAYGYQYDGLGNNGCYKLTHWVKCCDGWYKFTQCFCITQSSNKSANPVSGQVVPIPNSSAKMKLIKPWELKVTETSIEKADEKEIPESLRLKLPDNRN